jgi:hypothetical protein
LSPSSKKDERQQISHRDMNNRKTTSPSVATAAARILQSSSASATAKSLAGSALSQRSPSHQTGASMEDLAARVLDSRKYSAETKSIAGSVLSQANKQR